MILPENYQNEILNAQMSNRRQYQMIDNVNGTVSFIDVTVYDQQGSIFDADDINDICTQINLNTSKIEELELAIDTGGGGGGTGLAIIVADSLPTTDIKQKTIYLIPSDSPKTKNVKDEYINLDGTTSGWELIGSTKIDMTQYYTKTEINNILSGAVITKTEFQVM